MMVNAVQAGILLPADVLTSRLYIILATLVALNTTIFAALALVKLLPRWSRPAWLTRAHARSETRSIYPDLPSSVALGEGDR